MKSLKKSLQNTLTKNFIFFSIPILISILSFVYTKYTSLLSEKRIELALIKERVKEDLQKREILENRNIIQLEYIKQYDKILKQLESRTLYKDNVVKNLFEMNNDLTDSTITQLKNHARQISINIGENLIYSEDNFDFNIPFNKNLTIVLQTEYDQNNELIKSLKENKISDKYSDLDNKLWAYTTAISLSSKDSLNTSGNRLLTLHYDNEEISNLQNQVNEIKKSSLENFYLFLVVINILAILFLISISISKKYFHASKSD